jgi:hypothetical protein
VLPAPVGVFPRYMPPDDGGDASSGGGKPGTQKKPQAKTSPKPKDPA